MIDFSKGFLIDMTIAKKVTSPLFHATHETFDRPKVGSDLVFWTAESSAICQAYLPSAEGAIQTRHIFASDMNEPVRPNRADPLYAVAIQMGFVATDIQLSRTGIAEKWRQPSGYPRYKDMIAYIENVLGYTSVHPIAKSYCLKRASWNARTHQDEIAPANYQKPGTLWIIEGHEKMRLFDMEASHQHGQHLLDVPPPTGTVFERLISQGYDGVIIPDHCHSQNLGNIAHRSIGLFIKSLACLEMKSIPATHFDWSPGGSSLVLDSPEYASWRRAGEALRMAAEAEKIVFEVYDHVIANKRLRDGRDTVPKGTHGMVMARNNRKLIIEFAGDITMECDRADVGMRDKHDKLEFSK